MRVRSRLTAIIFICALFLAAPSRGQAEATPELVVPPHTRLLVVSPHPDDGTLAGAGLIARVLATGGHVRILQITSGDAFANGVKAIANTDRPTPDDYRRYGALRERETVSAMAVVGVRRKAITFLGFPDDGLCRLVSDYRSAALAYESPYTKRDSPPVMEQIVRGAAYRGDDAERELERVAAEFRPTMVLVPSARDEHPDHCSTHLLVHSALAAAGLHPQVMHFLIHYGVWPPETDGIGPASAQKLTPPVRLRTADMHWLSLTLTPGESRMKSRALAAYQSQVLAIGPFLKAFERVNELFAEGDPETIAPCWCRGQDVAGARTKPAATAIHP
ncbi:MAG TPA: PIG-L family deacetylase [Vicinamibacterales bacterium]